MKLIITIAVLCSAAAYADCCCQGYGGILYADTSSGRFVCKDGSVSQCFSSRRAVMNMQKIKGCCLWNGGVREITPTGKVICRNGLVSEICSMRPHEKTLNSL